MVIYILQFIFLIQIILLKILLRLNFVSAFILIFFATQCYSQLDSSGIKKDTLQIISKKTKSKQKGFVIYADEGKSYLRFKGEIRLNGAFDFNGLQAQQSFDVYEIPVDSNNTPDGRFYIGVFQTRFGIEARKESPLGSIFMKFEGDFLGNNNNFRIRQAYGEVNSFLLGKAKSLFGDPEAMPTKVDRDGPNFSMSERTIQIRFEPKLKDKIQWGVALETPDPDITNPDSAEVSPYYQSIPELASHFKYQFNETSHLQLAGIFRNINVRNLNGSLEFIQGWGGLLSGTVGLFENNNFKFQAYYGRAMSKYVKVLNGEGLDVIFNNIQNAYEPIYVGGGIFSFYQKWNEFLFSDFTAGYAKINNIESQPYNAFKEGYYGSVNLFVRLVKESEAGFEYSYGKRTDINNGYGNASRFSFITFFYF